MRRQGEVFDAIVSAENLRLAFCKAARGRGAEPEVAQFRARLQENLEAMRRDLLGGTLALGDYFFFTVRDPKVRRICAAPFRERVLQHALMNVCEPHFERFLIFDTYACRKGKGNVRAIARAQDFARKNDWYLKLDIAKYFDSIDHAAALALLQRRFKDRRLVRLFETILNTYETAPGKGLPIGNLFSQHLANQYLGVFDHWLKEQRRWRHYLRYMDDMLLFGASRQALAQELECIRRFLEEKLHLRLKSNVQLNRVRYGVPFLGFRIFPGHVRLGAQAKRRFAKKYAACERLYRAGVWTALDLTIHAQALTAFTQTGDCKPFRRCCLSRSLALS